MSHQCTAKAQVDLRDLHKLYNLWCKNQEGEETWMEKNGTEVGLSNARPSALSLTFGIQSKTPAAATNFFDQDGAFYHGVLEEALMRADGSGETDGGINSAFLIAKHATLEIFPPSPMRFHQTPRENSKLARSTTDSGSAQNSVSYLESDSPASRRGSSEMYPEHKKQQQAAMMAPGASRTTTARSLQLSSTQEKRKMTGSTAARDGKVLDAKTIRRLAQNREAARKSRLRKKAYVQQLESSRIRLQQMEQDLQRARSQGFFVGVAGSTNGATSSAAMFDLEYGRWLDENCRHMSELRRALQAHLPDGNLSHIVDQCISHYDDLFRLKAIVVNSDVFHLLNGTWKTPAERCFLWMGGFRPSELISILIPQLDPLTEQQFMGICSLQHSSQQAEEALSQGFGQLHQALAKTVAEGCISDSIDGRNYVTGQMALALRKLANLEGFVIQADNLRQQTLHQLRQILTIRQAARCFLAIGEYYTRLRTLSSFWASRSRESLMANDSVVVPTTSDIQIVHQSLQAHFPGY